MIIIHHNIIISVDLLRRTHSGKASRKFDWRQKQCIVMEEKQENWYKLSNKKNKSKSNKL